MCCMLWPHACCSLFILIQAIATQAMNIQGIAFKAITIRAILIYVINISVTPAQAGQI